MTSKDTTSAAILGAAKAITKDWSKQRKAEERNTSAVHRRRCMLARTRSITIKEAAWRVMERAYRKASGNGALPAHARQVMYAARGEIQEMTGRALDDGYFTQTLLPDFMRENEELTAEWDVVFDARGHLVEPHTEVVVPLGTLDVRDYLSKAGPPVWSEIGLQPMKLSTHGPDHRYGAILFIEKEGFMPLFKKVKLAERYDVAIMSTKGLSNTASRQLVDEVCSDYDVPLLVLHDFDKAGFSIVGTLQRDTRRYEFQNDIEVIDLGLRLAGVRAYDLPAERVHWGRESATSVRWNLMENGATEDEIAFLVNERVELNAFASKDLVDWIEAKLREHGIAKVVPDAGSLVSAYRNKVVWLRAQEHMDHLQQALEEHAGGVAVPDNLEQRIAELLEKSADLSWDAAVGHFAEAEVEAVDDPVERRKRR